MYYQVVTVFLFAIYLFICLWQRFGVVMYYSVAILSDCMGSNLASCGSYYTFYFVEKKKNFEKHPDYVPSVFPNNQRAKRVVTPSWSIRSIRRNSREIQENGKCKTKAKSTLISNKETRTEELDMLTTTSKNIPASPAGIITSEDFYANKNDTTFDLSSSVSVSERESFCFELPISVQSEMHWRKKLKYWIWKWHLIM